MRLLAGLTLAALVATGCTTFLASPRYSGDANCKLGEEDRAWLEGAPAVASLVQRDILRLKASRQKISYLLFDGVCAYAGVGDGAWTASAHNGLIRTPDGGELPPQVTSFVGPVPGGAFMTMSLPSIWRAANVPDRGDMRAFLYSVFAHEVTHLRQSGATYDRVTELGATAGISDDDMSDDVVQDRFGDNAEFKASVERERDALLAGFAGDEAAARAAAKEALGLIRARQAKWYTGANAGLAELEDIFLTLEGVGQLAGYSWLVRADGGARSSADAVAQMRTRWWSQEEGLAIMLVVSRLVPDWPARAFGEKPVRALELLALAAGER